MDSMTHIMNWKSLSECRISINEMKTSITGKKDDLGMTYAAKCTFMELSHFAGFKSFFFPGNPDVWKEACNEAD